MNYTNKFSYELFQMELIMLLSKDMSLEFIDSISFIFKGFSLDA